MTFRTPIIPSAAHHAEDIAGRWVEIIYAASLLREASRPMLVITDERGASRRIALPAPVLGRAVWIGRIEPETVEAWLESAQELRLESVRPRGLPWRIARAVRRHPRHAAAAFALALMGRTARARTRLSRALTEAPLSAYANWSASRRRAYEPEGLDAPPPGLNTADVEVSLAPGETLLPHAVDAVALAFAADPAMNALQGDSEIVVNGRVQAGFASAWTLATGAIFRRRGASDGAPTPFRAVLTRHPSQTIAPKAAEPDPDTWPDVAIVIPTRDRLDLLKACIDSVLARTDYPSFRILIADNDSKEPATRTFLDEAPRRDTRIAVVRCPGPFNFSVICNGAAAACGGDVLVFLNNDIEATDPSWLKTLVRQALRPDIGAVGPTLLYPDGRIQHAGVALGLGGTAGHVFAGCALSALAGLAGARRVSAVTGACLAVRRDRFEAVGGFDQTFPVDFGDIDLCLRLGARGWGAAWLPETRLIHRESATRGRTRDDGDAGARFAARWAAVIAADPHFHPAFSTAALDPALG